MSQDTRTDDAGFVVLDPSLNPWQRRYFFQPSDGPGRRAFTARRAAAQRPGRVGRLCARWDAARDRETARRGRVRWL